MHDLFDATLVALRNVELADVLPQECPAVRGNLKGNHQQSVTSDKNI
jgi:hypothetical protein